MKKIHIVIVIMRTAINKYETAVLGVFESKKSAENYKERMERLNPSENSRFSINTHNVISE